MNRVNRKCHVSTYFVGDGGDFVGTASRILRPKKPLSWLDPGAYGTLGVGGGFALGKLFSSIVVRLSGL